MECPECPGPTSLVEDSCSGDTVCTGCGLVLDSHAFQTPAFHEGAPMEATLASQTIARAPRNLVRAAGDSSKLRGLVASCCELQASAARISLPSNVTEQACSMWQRVLVRRVCKGDVRTGLIAACLYYACKILGFPRTKASIAGACLLPLDVVAKGLKLYTALDKDAGVAQALPTDSRDVISGLLAKAVCLVPARLLRRVHARARQVDEKASSSGVLEGRTPVVRAAAALYCAMATMGLPCAGLFREVGVSHNTLSCAVAVVRRHA